MSEILAYPRLTPSRGASREQTHSNSNNNNITVEYHQTTAADALSGEAALSVLYGSLLQCQLHSIDNGVDSDNNNTISQCP